MLAAPVSRAAHATGAAAHIANPVDEALCLQLVALDGSIFKLLPAEMRKLPAVCVAAMRKDPGTRCAGARGIAEQC